MAAASLGPYMVGMAHPMQRSRCHAAVTAGAHGMHSRARFAPQTAHALHAPRAARGSRRCVLPRALDPFQPQPAALAAEAVLSPTTDNIPAAPQPWFPYERHTWTWRGYRTSYYVAGCGSPVILVHGFGANAKHWRRTMPELARHHKVYAIDLLGFGDSEKPGDRGFQFTTEVWADQVLDFAKEFVGSAPVVLVGNSIGSLTCIIANARAQQAGVTVRGMALLNTAGAMNNKGIAEDWRVILALPVIYLIDFLLNQPSISRNLFDRFRSRANVANVLRQVYVNHDAVDDDLVNLIVRPAEDAGALETFVSIITGPPGPRPDKLVREGLVTGPMLFLWGDRDPFTPMDGPIGRYFQSLPSTRPDTTFTVLPQVGHCPHDDSPDAVHAHLLPWLRRVCGSESEGGEEGRVGAGGVVGSREDGVQLKP